jgi:hypothetical protein
MMDDDSFHLRFLAHPFRLGKCATSQKDLLFTKVFWTISGTRGAIVRVSIVSKQEAVAEGRHGTSMCVASVVFGVGTVMSGRSLPARVFVERECKWSGAVISTACECGACDRGPGWKGTVLFPGILVKPFEWPSPLVRLISPVGSWFSPRSADTAA